MAQEAERADKVAQKLAKDGPPPRFEAVFSDQWRGLAFNRELLAEQTAEHFGDWLFGHDCPPDSMDTRGMGLILKVPADVEDVDKWKAERLAEWDDLILAHDPSVKTADQLEAEATAAKEAAVKASLTNWDTIGQDEKNAAMKAYIELGLTQKEGP